jgi:hypothetical protein
MVISFVKKVSFYFKYENSVIKKRPIAIPVATTNPIMAVLELKESLLDPMPPTFPDKTDYWILHIFKKYLRWCLYH